MICEHDVLGEGLPLYHVERTIRETHKPFGDKAQIIYVNGDNRDDTPLGRLMHDFFCRDANEMYYAPLAQRMKLLKEDKGGAIPMCEVVEELMRDLNQDVIRQSEARGEARAKEEGVVAVMSTNKFSLDEIAALFKLPLAKVEELGHLHHLI